MSEGHCAWRPPLSLQGWPGTWCPPALAVLLEGWRPRTRTCHQGGPGQAGEPGRWPAPLLMPGAFLPQ